MNRVTIAALAVLAASSAAFAGSEELRTNADSSFGELFSFDELFGPQGPRLPIPFPRDPRDDDRRDRDRWGGRGRTCYGVDAGHEEHGRRRHWGRDPRQACRACADARHGRCDWFCEETAVQCRAEWVGDDGRRQTYEGRPGVDRWEAEREAVDHCYTVNRGLPGRCTVIPDGCQHRDIETDRGYCGGGRR